MVLPVVIPVVLAPPTLIGYVTPIPVKLSEISSNIVFVL